jgi:hypothetical protein
VGEFYLRSPRSAIFTRISDHAVLDVANEMENGRIHAICEGFIDCEARSKSTWVVYILVNLKMFSLASLSSRIGHVQVDGNILSDGFRPNSSNFIPMDTSALLGVLIYRIPT